MCTQLHCDLKLALYYFYLSLLICGSLGKYKFMVNIIIMLLLLWFCACECVHGMWPHSMFWYFNWKSIKLIDIMNVRINVACLERLVMSKKAKDLGRKGVSFYFQERVMQEMV